MTTVPDTALLRGALAASSANGRYDPTARSEVYVRPDAEATGPVDNREWVAELDAAKPTRPASPFEPMPHGGGAPKPMDGEVAFDASEVADRLAAGPIHPDYTPPPVFVDPRHRP